MNEHTPGAAPLFGRDEVLDNTYRILEGIAAGGMGEVYRAAHLRMPRVVAIKTLQPELAARQEWVTRFCREACVLAQLRHPNIVQVLDFNVTTSGVPYMAMELIEGRDLREELETGRRFDPAEIMSIIRQVASALEAAHTAGVVHRDLKPENIVLSPAPGQSPVVKVIDFGLSTCGWSARVTADRTVFGTPDYMAPEQAQGQHELIDARTDQFALAVLAYALLSGRTPFSRDTPIAILYAVVHDAPAPLGTVEGHDLAPVERVLLKGMARERDDRFTSVLAFADALEAALVEADALPRPSTPEPLAIVSSSDSSSDERSTALPPPSKLRALGRGLPVLVVSLVVLGVIWGGVVGARAARGGAGWRGDLETARATLSSQWTRLRGSPGPAPPRAGAPNANAPNGK